MRLLFLPLAPFSLIPLPPPRVVAALNGIAVVRVYFLVSTGARHATGVPVGATRGERAAALVPAALNSSSVAVTLRDRQADLGGAPASHE